MVKKGDFLAQIDPRPYQVALEQAEAALAKDQALLAQAQSDLKRYETLAKQNSIAQQQARTSASWSRRTWRRPRPTRPAGRAVVDRRAVLGHDQRLLRKIEDLTPLLADLGIRRKSRPAMCAHLGRVLDDRVRLGDLTQRVAVVTFLPSARLARARAQALQDPRLLLQPVARGRLRAVGAVQAQPTPKLRHLSAKTLDLACLGRYQGFDFRRKISSAPLSQKSLSLSPKITTLKSIPRRV